MRKAIVIGAGIAGLTAAWELSKLRWAVTCCERERVVGAACTRASLGLVYPLSPATSPMAMVDATLRSWLNYEEYIAELNCAAGSSVRASRHSLLDVASNSADEQRILAELQSYKEIGFDGEYLSPGAAQEREPALKTSSAGAHYRGCYHVDATALIDALADAVRVNGGEVLVDAHVHDLFGLRGGRSEVLLADGTRLNGDLVVIATGATSFVSSSGLRVQMAPTRGQVIVARSATRWLRNLLYVDGLDIVQREDGTTLIGGTREIGEGLRKATVSGVTSLLQRLARSVKIPTDLEFERVMVGLRPHGRNQMPTVGPLPGNPTVIVFGGLYRNGIVMSPDLSRRLARSVEDGQWSTYLSDFLPAA